MSDRLESRGWELRNGVFAPEHVGEAISALGSGARAASIRGGETYGARNLLSVPAIRALAALPSLRRLVEPVLGTRCRAVRALFFDKTANANWPVRWHQDVTLCVSERTEIPGWGPWSAKQGLPHVQAPARVVAQMLSLRLHLDANTRETGALRVMSGTHRLGRLSQQDIDRLRETQEAEICEGPAGSVLLMRPLLLHASSPATRPSHRRVLHFEFAPDDLLPSGLSWTQEA